MKAKSTDIEGIKKLFPAEKEYKDNVNMVMTMYTAYYLPTYLRKVYAVIHKSLVDPLVKSLAGSRPEDLGFRKKDKDFYESFNPDIDGATSKAAINMEEITKICQFLEK